MTNELIDSMAGNADRLRPGGGSCASISIDRLCEVLAYHPETGEFRWRIPLGTKKAGEIAGGVQPVDEDRQYWRIRIDGHQFYGQRLAWALMTGVWPEREVDHADTDTLNNRWTNLREATHGQNQQNKPALATNMSGHKGVSFDAERQKYRADIRAGGNHHFLGRFDTKEDAAAAYEKASADLHGEFSNLTLLTERNCNV